MIEGMCQNCDVTYPDSTAIPWSFSKGHQHEQFHLMTLVFDVDLAKKIVQQRSHPIRNVSKERFKLLVEARNSKGISIFGGVGPEEDLTKCEIDIPVIYALLPNANEKGQQAGQMIDGTHRATRRLEVGCETVPAIVLTPEESALVAQQFSDSSAFKLIFGVSKAEALRRAKALKLPRPEAF